MNKVILVGRLSKEPELRATGSGVSVCNFSVACDRRFVKEGEERKADFINCIAWRQTGEFVSKYFHKGNRIALEGSLQTRDYTDNEGKKRYVTEVLVDNVEFAQSKSESSGTFSGGSAAPSAVDQMQNDTDDFMDISGMIEDDDFPF